VIEATASPRAAATRTFRERCAHVPLSPPARAVNCPGASPPSAEVTSRAAPTERGARGTLTGCRLNEIMTLKWGHVDFAAGCMRLTGSKVGARAGQLGAPALEVLARLGRRTDNPWVICGKNRGTRRTDLQPPWQRFRKRATVRLWARRESTPEALLVAGLNASSAGTDP
jgi:integrase